MFVAAVGNTMTGNTMNPNISAPAQFSAYNYNYASHVL